MVTSKVETVTPEIAIQDLERGKAENVNQRTLKQSHVDWLAKQITDKKWRTNGEPLIYDNAGRILDGQHRLWAVVQAQTEIQCMVVRGVDPETFITIDTGIASGGADVLHIMGHKNANTLNSALGWLHRINVGGMLGTAKAAGYTHEIGVKLLERNKAIADSVEWAERLRKDPFLRNIPPASLAALHYKFCCYGVDACTTFFQQVMAEKPCAADSGPASLRKWLSNKGAKEKVANNEIMAVAVKSFIAFVGNEKVSHLAWRRFGDKPESFPIFPGDDKSSGQARKRSY